MQMTITWNNGDIDVCKEELPHYLWEWLLANPDVREIKIAAGGWRLEKPDGFGEPFTKPLIWEVKRSE